MNQRQDMQRAVSKGFAANGSIEMRQLAEELRSEDICVVCFVNQRYESMVYLCADGDS